MNPKTENQILKSKLKKRFVIMSAIWIFAFVTLYSCVIAPLLVYVESDTLLDASALPVILETVRWIVDIAVLSLGYGFVIYAIYEFGFKGALPIIAVPVIATVYRYSANSVISYVMSRESMLIDYMYVIFYSLAEFAMLAIFLAIANKYVSSHKEIEVIRSKGLKYLGKEDDSTPVLPFSRIIDLKNPIQKSTFIISIIMSAIRIASRIHYDIDYSLENGHPEGFWSIFKIIVYYFSDVLIMPITYAIMILAVLGGYNLYLKLKIKLSSDS